MFGVVKDAFIPWKRSKRTGNRFGFVRYDCHVSASMAVSRMNGIWVEDKKLFVKEASFGRNEEMKDTRAHERRETVFRNRDQLSHKVGHAANSMAGLFGQVWCNKDPGRTFVQVVNGKLSKKPSTNVTIQVNPVGNGWLFRSAVAVMHRVVPMMTLKASFGMETDKIAQFRALGGGGGGEVWGHFILAHDDTLRSVSFAQGKLLIATEEMSKIERWIQLVVKGVKYDVLVKEISSFVNLDEVADASPLIHSQVQVGNGLAAKGFSEEDDDVIVLQKRPTNEKGRVGEGTGESDSATAHGKEKKKGRVGGPKLSAAGGHLMPDKRDVQHYPEDFESLFEESAVQDLALGLPAHLETLSPTKPTAQVLPQANHISMDGLGDQLGAAWDSAGGGAGGLSNGAGAGEGACFFLGGGGGGVFFLGGGGGGGDGAGVAGAGAGTAAGGAAAGVGVATGVIAGGELTGTGEGGGEVTGVATGGEDTGVGTGGVFGEAAGGGDVDFGGGDAVSNSLGGEGAGDRAPTEARIMQRNANASARVAAIVLGCLVFSLRLFHLSFINYKLKCKDCFVVLGVGLAFHRSGVVISLIKIVLLQGLFDIFAKVVSFIKMND
ncbi:hypothetical protein RHMOL_Rhmol10G0134500 [Rhododendron molle]|uniref:Uncharacterized protein n=1 Tax=Rhododendron molle TaxID=49168 RepID=A0ACC0M1P9_RHOML|nr:hypothetical protein RHMOL_Rhmol10G0134500 [Rhododendron molle]